MDPLSIGLGLLGAGLSFGGATMQGDASRRANRIERENLQLQKDMFAYQKDLQQKIFKREDTAWTRKFGQLRRAGISPLAALQGPGARAGAIVAPTVPQRGVRGAEVQARLGQSVMASELHKSLAETALLQEQARKTGVEADFSAQTFTARANQINEQLEKLNLHNRFADASFWARLKEVMAMSRQAVHKEVVLAIDAERATAFNAYLLGKGTHYQNVSPERVALTLQRYIRDMQKTKLDFYEREAIARMLGFLRPIVGAGAFFDRLSESQRRALEQSRSEVLPSGRTMRDRLEELWK